MTPQRYVHKSVYAQEDSVVVSHLIPDGVSIAFAVRQHTPHRTYRRRPLNRVAVHATSLARVIPFVDSILEMASFLSRGFSGLQGHCHSSAR